MKRTWIIGLLVAVIICGCNDNAELRKEFVNPPLSFRMNQNIHSVPMDSVGQDSLIESYYRNGYGGFASNVDFHHYLTDEGMKSFLRFSNQVRKRGMSLWLYDERGYPSGNAGDLVIKSNPDWESKMDLSARIEHSVLSWNVPAGHWKILTVTKYRLYENFQASAKDAGKLGANYPSLMLPEVTQKFIELTHEAYRKYMGDDLGAYFVSTFTDEPSLMAVPFGLFPWSVIPWIGLLSDEIQKRYGYRPEEKLEFLFMDEGPKGQEVRYHYFNTMADLIANNYFKPIRQWCHEHNFRSGGHLLLEETLMAHVPLYGDAFRCLREMDVPGIDVLSCFPALTPIHSPKLASGAAELTGADRVMCEPCPVADRIKLGGQETPADHVKGFLNIQLLGGVTDFNNYLQLSNSDQEEKKEFNTYVARIAMLLRGGYTKAIIDAEVKDGKPVHGLLQWKVVILPAVNTLPAEAWKKLALFEKTGGIVISLNALPENSESHFPDETVLKIGKEIFNSPNKSVILNNWSPSELDKLLKKFLVKDFRLGDEQVPVRYCHRVIDGRDCFFLINDSDKEVNTSLQFDEDQRFTEWDPATGNTKRVKGVIELELKPFHGKVYRN